MWRHLSLRARLNVLCGSLLALALAINMGSLVAGAGTRVDAEVNSSMRLSGEFVDAALANLHGNAHPDAALDRLVASLQNLRHVRIFREWPGAVEPRSAARNGAAPRWFVRIVHPAPKTMRIAATLDKRSFGDIVIASYPYDEIREIWEAVRSLALLGTGLVVAIFALTFWIVDRTLVPIRALGTGLGRLAQGDYTARLAPSGPPEFIAIGAKLNFLSEMLARTEAENRVLVQKLISVQDDERKQLARELHDEFGAHLFAIRANMTSLVMAAERGTSDPERTATTSRSILDLVDNLQRLNRRILGRLRPMALGELGLAEAVRGLTGMWSSGHPEVRVTVELPDPLEDLEEPIGLTVYRVVQESLTNVFRHASASEVAVRVAYADDTDGPVNSLRVMVRDNGVGIAPSAKPGLGLLGMRERVRALGGHLTVAAFPGGGTVLEARIPLEPGVTLGVAPESHTGNETTPIRRRVDANIDATPRGLSIEREKFPSQ